MKKLFTLPLLMVVCAFAAYAQFNIKLPKIKTEKPKTEEKAPETPPQKQPVAGRSNGRIYVQTMPGPAAVLLKDSIYIKAAQHDEYWKMPNQRDYSSWVPEIRINLFYDGSRPLKYSIAYFNPDGTPWFSQDLDHTGSMIRSPSMYDVLNSKSTVAVGVFSFKITDTQTSTVVFQGKFKVGKVSRAFNPVRDKNKFDFFVDYDGLMPFGVIGFPDGDLSKGVIFPIVRVWIKGPVEQSELEARLFFGGRQIASTADGTRGNVVTTNREFLSSYAPAFAPNNIWKQWEFVWGGLALDNGNDYNKEWFSNTHFFDKNPGEYIVKLYRKGAQIRELGFSVGADGRFVVPAYSSQVPLANHQFIVPVKVLDPNEKWNAAAWKTDAFFGNPVTGFSVP